MKFNHWILLTLSGLLLLFIILLPNASKEGSEVPVFSGKERDIVEIQYQGPMQHLGKPIQIKYKLTLQDGLMDRSKSSLKAEVSLAEKSAPIEFPLLPSAISYFEDLARLSALESLPDVEADRKSIGFERCDHRVTLIQKEGEQVICLGPLNYNKSRQYILLPTKKIYVTYRHVWQRYENSIFNMADNSLIGQNDLYNYLEVVFSENYGKHIPTLFKVSKGRLALVPKKVKVGLSREKETIAWEFKDQSKVPVHFASRLQASLAALKIDTLVRPLQKPSPDQPLWGVRLAARAQDDKEKTVDIIRFFSYNTIKEGLTALDGTKVKSKQPSLFVDTSLQNGLISNQKMKALDTLFKEMDEAANKTVNH